MRFDPYHWFYLFGGVIVPIAIVLGTLVFQAMVPPTTVDRLVSGGAHGGFGYGISKSSESLR